MSGIYQAAIVSNFTDTPGSSDPGHQRAIFVTAPPYK